MGIGFREISMSSAAIGPAKWVILNTDISEIETFVENALQQNQQPSDNLRNKLKQFVPESL